MKMKLFHYLAFVCIIFGGTIVTCSDIIEKERQVYPSKLIFEPLLDHHEVWACSMDVSNCDDWNCDKWKLRINYTAIPFNEYASRNNIIYRFLGEGQLMVVLDMYGNETKIQHPFNASSSLMKLMPPYTTVVYKGYLYTNLRTKLFKCSIDGTEMCQEFMDDERFRYVREIKFHMEYIYMRSYGRIERCSNFSVCEVHYSSNNSDPTAMAFHGQNLYMIEWPEYPANPYLRRCNIDTMNCYTLNLDTAGVVIKSIEALYIYRKSIYIATFLASIDSPRAYWKCNLPLPNATACQQTRLSDREVFVDEFAISYSSVQMLRMYREEDTRCSWQPAIVCPLHYVTYERDNTHLQLGVSRDGKLIDANGTLFDTSNAGYTMQYNGAVKMRTAIFVMDNGGSIYASNYHAPYKYHHSSLMAGKPVSSAGVLQVSNGVINFVSSCSDHYQVPPQIAEQFADSLIAQGYNASVVTMVHNCTYETLAKSYHALIGDPVRTCNYAAIDAVPKIPVASVASHFYRTINVIHVCCILAIFHSMYLAD